MPRNNETEKQFPDQLVACQNLLQQKEWENSAKDEKIKEYEAVIAEKEKRIAKKEKQLEKY